MAARFPIDFHWTTHEFKTTDGSIWKIQEKQNEFQLVSDDKTLDLMKGSRGEFTVFTENYEQNINLHGFVIDDVLYTLDEVLPNENYVSLPEPIIEEDEDPISDLDLACLLFRETCTRIGEVLGIHNFRGGYDEILSINKTQQTKLRREGLLERLTFVNSFCNHEANKVNMEAPKWWYHCWGVTIDQEEQEDEE